MNHQHIDRLGVVGRVIRRNVIGANEVGRAHLEFSVIEVFAGPAWLSFVLYAASHTSSQYWLVSDLNNASMTRMPCTACSTP